MTSQPLRWTVAVQAPVPSQVDCHDRQFDWQFMSRRDRPSCDSADTSATYRSVYKSCTFTSGPGGSARPMSRSTDPLRSASGWSESSGTNRRLTPGASLAIRLLSRGARTGARPSLILTANDRRQVCGSLSDLSAASSGRALRQCSDPTGGSERERRRPRARLFAGTERCSRVAAPDTLPVSRSASKTRSRFRSRLSLTAYCPK
jgi:hypothetical protein